MITFAHHSLTTTASSHNYLRIIRVGQNHRYIRCIYGVFGREITIHTVIYGVYIQFWPTLHIYMYGSRPPDSCALQGFGGACNDKKRPNGLAHPTHVPCRVWGTCISSAEVGRLEGCRHRCRPSCGKQAQPLVVCN